MTGNAGNVHATGIVLGSRGILIRGESGAGKTSLALALIELWQHQNRFARMIADDQLFVDQIHGRVVASAPEAIVGLAEHRGWGPRPTEYLPAAIVDRVIDLVDAVMVERLPEHMNILLLDSVLPRLALPVRTTAVSVGTAARWVLAEAG